MGKYTRKGKISGELTVTELSHHQPPDGVRTRARTLSASAAAASAADDSSLSYLELRSRRLEKPAPPPGPTAATGTKCKAACRSAGGASLEARLGPRSAAPALRMHSVRGLSNEGEDVAEATATVDWAPDVEVSSGDNVLDFEDGERFDRETTPCSSIMNSEMMGAPSSTTRPRNSSATNHRRNSINPNIPTSQDMEEFFANTEHLQQQHFQEKYNFDFANEYPLPGRYEWVKDF